MQAQRLAILQADAVVSSPLERALQTAEPLAARLGLRIEVAEEATEVDFGEWSGKTIQELETLPEWKIFNIFRSSAHAPGGELMLEVQARIVTGLNRLADRYTDKTIAVFSHADVIKAALMHFAGSPLDFMFRFEIGPASITRIELHEWGPRVLSVNEPCPQLPDHG